MSSRQTKSRINLRSLDFSPQINPLMEPKTIEVKRRYVRSARSKDLVDPLTGEITAVTTVHIVEDRDDAEFVKVFSDGVKAAFNLSRTAHRVFQAVLDEYQNTPMTKGYADSIYLHFFDGGLSGRSITPPMSDKTFQRGLKELLDKDFLAPKSPNLYWVNPALFFKGDRVAFIKEYRRRKESKDETERSSLEENGQQRLIE